MIRRRFHTAVRPYRDDAERSSAARPTCPPWAFSSHLAEHGLGTPVRDYGHCGARATGDGRGGGRWPPPRAVSRALKNLTSPDGQAGPVAVIWLDDRIATAQDPAPAP